MTRIRQISASLCALAAFTVAQAQDGGKLPADASSLPDVEESDAGPASPDTHDLPSWGDEEPKLVARLWPGNSNSPDSPANPDSPAKSSAVFEPEIQLPPEIDPSVIPDLYLADYFGTVPETFLVDPQTLLTAHERTSVNHALRLHAAEYGVPVYILLFQKEQQIPDFQSLESLHRRWIGGQPGAVIGFWLGSPARTSAYFGDSLRQSFGAQLDKAFADALGQSYTKTYPFSQLDHFTYTLLWRLGHLDQHATEPSVAAPSPGTNLLTVPEFPEEKPTGWIPIAATGSAIALGLAAIGAGFVASLRKRERKQKVIPPKIFPDTPRAERFGAPHSGGSGAMVSVPLDGPKFPS